MLAPTRLPAADYGGRDPWTDATLGSQLRAAVGDHGDRLAVVDGGTRLTYRQVAAAVDAMAAELSALGVRRGDVVTVQLPNWWEAVVLFHAVVRLGAVVNPVVTIYRQTELSFILAQARPRVVVVPDGFRGHDHVGMIQEVVAGLSEPDRPAVVVARPSTPPGPGLHPLTPPPGGGWPAEAGTVDARVGAGPGPGPGAGAGTGTDPGTSADVQGPGGADAQAPDDLVLLLYTSGTTASPKGVLHSHRTLLYECRSIAELFGLDDRSGIFMASPLTHITGLLYGIVLPPMLAATCVLMDVWEPEGAADLIEAHGCAFTVAATPFLSGLTTVYERRGHPSALRHFGCGGADVPPELVRRATHVLGANVTRLYGSSEMPTYSSGRPADDLAVKSGTDGYPIGPAEGRLADPVDGVGELEVRGPELFWGYLDPELNEASFTADGYFRTGDLASFDDRGFVTIRGRLKDIIIRKGEKISAREIEDMLYQHPDVADVAVVAVPDPDLGERACAVVVPAPGASPALSDLCAYLRTFNVATQKLPEDLAVLPELPRNAAGKVQKFLIREQLAARSVGG